jgi:CubicO group peptidase (beta-lactamase class C family)
MCKLGTLLLNMGVYGSQRVVSESYIRAATSQQTPPHDYPYGFYFHINTSSSPAGRQVNLPDGYLALGQGEQFILVSPQKKLVVAGFSSSWHRPGTGKPRDRERITNPGFRVLDVLNETILAKL